MGSNSFGKVLSESLSRRDFNIIALATIPILSLPNKALASPELGFTSVSENQSDLPVFAEGYTWGRLISWGDPLFEGISDAIEKRGPPFEFTRQEQEKRFGGYNDMMALFAHEYKYPWQQTTPSRMIMCNNHEYSPPYMMLETQNGELKPSATEIEALYASQGVSVVEIEYNVASGSWNIIKSQINGGGLNQRITPFTEVIFDGPAKTHPWINAAKAKVNQSEAKNGSLPKSKDGILCGTMANCAGGFTPWGTYLTAEENFDNMFFDTWTSPGGEASPDQIKARETDGFEHDESSFGIGNRWRLGGPEQFDLASNPHGPSLYGWIVEIDPYDKNWIPRKRTALGRRKSECATCVLSKRGHAVTYSGDDQVNEFVYKFVSSGRFNPKNRTANRNLLSSGKLYAARFEADGTGRWIEISLTAANRAPRGGFDDTFKNYGDLMMRAREAARRLGATQMDRPEDVECPRDGTFMGQGSVYVMCTNNSSELGVSGNSANPRRKLNGTNDKNYTGQIIRIHEDKNDHAATVFTWEVFATGGDHSAPDVLQERTDGTPANLSSWIDGKQVTKGDRFASPDNITFDGRGFAWFTTDGMADSFACNDGIYAINTNGPLPRQVKRFLTGPLGGEITGPMFAPDFKTFFCGFQHIGEEGKDGTRYRGQLPKPYSTFPNQTWPRDSIVYVRRKDGGIIGT